MVRSMQPLLCRVQNIQSVVHVVAKMTSLQRSFARRSIMQVLLTDSAALHDMIFFLLSKTRMSENSILHDQLISITYLP